MSTDSPSWYIPGKGKEPAGPFTAEQLLQSWRSGTLDANTICWREGMDQWLPLAQVEPFAAVVRSIKPPPTPAAAVGGSSPPPLNTGDSSGMGRVVIGALTVLLVLVLVGAVGFIGHQEGWWASLKPPKSNSSPSDDKEASADPSASGFNVKNFEATKAWIEQKVQELVQLQRHGNDLAYKEGFDNIKKELQSTVGRRVTWELHVERVGSGGVHFQEEGDIQRDLMAAFNGTSPTRIEFARPPTIPVDQLRQLRAGNVIPITGIVTGVDTSNFPGRLAIRVDVDASSATSEPGSDNTEKILDVKHALQVTVSELVNAYKRNELLARDKYENRLLKVTGVFTTKFVAGWQFTDPTASETMIVDLDDGIDNGLRSQFWSSDLAGIEGTVVGNCKPAKGLKAPMLRVSTILPSMRDFLSSVDKRRTAERQANDKEIEERIVSGKVDRVITKSESWATNNSQLGSLKVPMLVEARCDLVGMDEKDDGSIVLELELWIGQGLRAHFSPKYKSQILKLSKGKMIVVRGRVCQTTYGCDLDRCVLVTSEEEKRAASDEPRTTPTSKEATYSEHMRKGDDALEKGKFDAAVVAYRTAHEALPDAIDAPGMLEAAKNHVGFLPIPFEETFTGVEEGLLPKSWNGDNTVGVCHTGNGCCLKNFGDRDKCVLTCPLLLKGDFEIEAIVSHPEQKFGAIGGFLMRLIGRNGTSDFQALVGDTYELASYNFGFGIASNECEGGISESSSFLTRHRRPLRWQEMTRNGNVTRFRVVRDGYAYHLFVKDRILTMKATSGDDSFRQLAFWLAGEPNGPHLVKLTVRRHPKDLPREPAGGFVEEFSKVSTGALPKGWIGDSAMGVRLAHNVRCLMSSDEGFHFVSTPTLTFPKNFEVAVRLIWPDKTYASSCEITLEGQGNSPDVVVGLAGDGNISMTGAATKKLQVDTDYRASTPMDIAVRHNGLAYVLSVNGNTIVAPRLPEYQDFRRITLCFDDRNQFSRVYRVSLTDLGGAGDPPAVELPKKPGKAGDPAVPEAAPSPPKGPLAGTWLTPTGAHVRIRDDGSSITIELEHSTNVEAFFAKLTRRPGKPEEFSVGKAKVTLMGASSPHTTGVGLTVISENSLKLRCFEWSKVRGGEYKPYTINLTRSDGDWPKVTPRPGRRANGNRSGDGPFPH